MRPSRGATLAATAALLVTGAACTSEKTPDAGDPGEPARAAKPVVRLYGADGNMSNSFGAEFKESPGLLAGMKGTTPLTPLEQSFKARLTAVDPGLEDFSYAAETYDAVVISAIAAELSRSTKSADIARFINGVTTVGDVCDNVRACLDLARAGKDLQYRGISLRRGGFTDAGEPAAASYATLHFGSADRLDDGKTEFVGAGDESATTRKESPKPPASRGRKRGDVEPLKIGGLLPHTGSLALMLPPMAAAAKLAIDEVNAGGGVLGQPVDWLTGDDGTNPEVAKRTVASHIEAGVQVIIGAGASGVTRAVLPDIVKAGVVLFSPCNTAADLSTAQDRGLYFRTAPSDLLQGKALADVILRDGVQKVAIVARDDAYGTGLQGIVKAELEQAGLPGGQIRTMKYPSAEDAEPDFGATADEVKSFEPDGVLVIGFGESAALIKAFDAKGVHLRE